MKREQTAVEWFNDQLDDILELYPSEWNEIQEAFTQAKAMEKDRIIKAYKAKFGGGTDPKWETLRQEQAEQYYNETYGDEENND